MKPLMDADEALKKLASESVKQGENLRQTVRELTLKALQSRELSLVQVKQVIKMVTEGINLGATTSKMDTGKLLSDALAGMDDALLKTAQASHLALQQTTNAGQDFQDSYLKKALDDLEKWESEWLKTVQQAAKSADEKVKAQWASVLQQTPAGHTKTGAQIAATMQEFGDRMHSTMRQQREVGIKAAHMLSQNFAALASGVLIGMSEGLQSQSKKSQ